MDQDKQVKQRSLHIYTLQLHKYGLLVPLHVRAIEEVIIHNS